MNSESRSFLKQQIQTYLQKYPDCTGKDVKKWILSGDQEFNLMDVQRDTLNKFIQYNLGKFREEGQCVKHKGGNGRKQTPRTVVARIKTLMLNKKRRSLRTVAAKVGKIHFTTVRNIMVKNKARAYHKRKVQKMSPVHMEKRLRFAWWALNQYGSSMGPSSVWRRLLNCDFSTFVKVD